MDDRIHMIQILYVGALQMCNYLLHIFAAEALTFLYSYLDAGHQITYTYRVASKEEESVHSD
jgi:hypothetical protein